MSKNRTVIAAVFGFFSAVLILLAFFLVVEVSLRFYSNHRSAESLDKFSADNVFAAKEEVYGNAKTLWEKKFIRYKANAHLEFMLGDDQLFSFSTNSKGYRTHEFGDKPDGVFRIIAIGGSTTVQGFTNDTTYPAILETMLKNKYPDLKLEVLNLGVSAGVSGTWKKRFQELLSYQPDLVLQYNAINDLRSYKRYNEYHQSNKLHRYLYMSRAYEKLFDFDAGKLANSFDSIFENFMYLENHLGQQGIDYITGSFAYPLIENIDPDFYYYLNSEISGFAGWAAALSFSEYSSFEKVLAEYNKQFRLYAAQNDLQYADVQGMIGDARYFIDTCHLRPEGIVLQARAYLPEVENVLRARGLIE